MQFKVLKILLLVILAIIFLAIFLNIFSHNVYNNLLQLFDPTVDRQFLITQFHTIGPLGFMAFIIILGIVSAIPGLPNSVVAVTAGIYFGPWLGSLFNIIGLVLGILLSVLAIRLTRDLENKKSPKANRFLNELLEMKHKKIGLMIGYAVPFIPTVLTNIAAVKMQTKLHVILLCALIGNLPTAIIYSFCGDSLLSGNYKKSLAIISIILILTLLLVFVHYDRKEHQQKQAE